MKKWKPVVFLGVFLSLTVLSSIFNVNSSLSNILPFLNLSQEDKEPIISIKGYDTAWIDNGVAICIATDWQSESALCSDGQGGAIIVWQDERSADPNPFDIYAQRIDSSGVTNWTNDGEIITTGLFNEEYPEIVSDGVGGAIMVWQDGRSGNWDIYAQRINSNGVVQWTANGEAICTVGNDQLYPQICSDGSQGAIITWTDWRAGTQANVYVQRINSTGGIEWAPNGIAPYNTSLSGDKENPQICSDNLGGAIVTWQDERLGPPRIYAQKIDTNGVAQWAENGTLLSGAGSNLIEPQIVSDDVGGAIVTWHDMDIHAQRVNSTGNVKWTANGVTLCAKGVNQEGPQICSDGNQGAIVVWYDVDIYAQRVDANGVMKWSINGEAICTATDTQQAPQICENGRGGAYITWQDRRSTSWEIYAQVINSTGHVQLMGNGTGICTGAYHFDPQICSDGSDGAIIAWTDYRGSDTDIYAQHVMVDNPPESNSPSDIYILIDSSKTINWILTDDHGIGKYRIWANDSNDVYYVWRDWQNWSNGSKLRVPINMTSLGVFNYSIEFNDSAGQLGSDTVMVTIGNAYYLDWTDNGSIACTADQNQEISAACSDGKGGAIITWADNRLLNLDIYAQRMDSTGYGLWKINGSIICNSSSDQDRPQICSDGNGGAIITWLDDRNGGGTPADIYARRINSTGHVQWTVNGIPICLQSNDQFSPRICSDGNNGAYITWYEQRGTDQDIYGQRVNSTGDVQWTTDGVVICSEAGNQYLPEIISDGTNGTFIAWQDYRAGNYDIYAQRINSSGCGLWTANGTVVCNAVDRQGDQKICNDGSNGLILTWEDDRPAGNSDVYAQLIDTTGTVQWGDNGMIVSSANGNQRDPAICTDGEGGAIVTWTDERDSQMFPDIYAQRITNNGLTNWTANGSIVCSFDDSQQGTIIAEDSSGGAFISWYDKREGITDLYVEHVNGSGFRFWDNDGVPISRATGSNKNELIIPDGLGNAFITWADNRRSNYDIYVQKIKLVMDEPPWSNEPDDITSPFSSNDLIKWTLSDDFGGGFYQVWINDSQGNYYIWKPWAPWKSSIPLDVEINRTVIGWYNYSIEYNDSLGQQGNRDWIIVIVRGNNGFKNALGAGMNIINQYDDLAVRWVRIYIFVEVATNVTITTNFTQPGHFENFTLTPAFLFYEIKLDNVSALINVTIEFYFNETLINGTPEKDLGIYYYDENSGSWRYVPFDWINHTSHFVRVTLYNLSKFVLGISPPEEIPLFPLPSEDSLMLIIGIVILSAAVVGIAIYVVKRRGKRGMPVVPGKRGAKPETKPKKGEKVGGLSVKRAYDYFGGNIRFKVVVKNESKESIQDISVTLDVKEQYELDSAVKKVKILDPLESLGIDFILTPLTCGITTVKADVSWKDAKGMKFSTSMEPSMVQVKCPLVTPRIVQLEEVRKLKANLQKSHTEIIYSDFDISNAYRIAKEQITSLDVTELDENESTHYALYSGEAKVGGQIIIIELFVNPEMIVVDVYLKDLRQATGFLAYLKNLITLAMKYSKQISTTLDKITNKISNAFEFGLRLTELFKLCQARENIDDILLMIKELNIKSKERFPDLMISEACAKWQEELEKIKEKEGEMWERTYLNLQHDVLSWLEKIILFSETNAKTYFESPSADEQTRRNIETRDYQLKDNLWALKEEYARKILFTLMLIYKENGLNIFTYNFTEKTLDMDLIGGFLTAIQSFGTELATAKETAMQKLSYKHFEIQLQDGNFIMAALITFGIPEQLTLDRQREFLLKFEIDFEDELKKFVGEISRFETAKDLVDKIFLKK